MQSYLKHIKRHLLVFVATVFLIAVVDILLYAFLIYGTVTPNLGSSGPAGLLEQTSDMLVLTNDVYSLPDNQKEMLSKNNIWCILVNTEGDVIWEFEVPSEIPHEYSLQDVAFMSRGYLQDYPVFVWEHGENLLVAGYPETSYIKILSNYLPYRTVQILPFYTMGILAFDLLILFFAYYFSKRSIMKNISPIVDAIAKLPSGENAPLKTKGDLAEISDSLNHVSAILERNDKARANWISGVSHDIRTPLSMILGYADRIAENSDASPEIQQQATIIRNQSIKIKGLIQDLNLVSKLEYDTQPITLKPLIPAKMLRSIVAGYLNNDLDERYFIEVDISEASSTLTVNGDIGLLKRAVENLIQNSFTHNPQGCCVCIVLDACSDNWSIAVKDNGKGISLTELINLQNKQHYLDRTAEQSNLRHGLGLLIVRQVVKAHNGTMMITSEAGQGFSVRITIPIDLL